MSNGTVGVTQGDAPDRLIDNDVLTVGPNSVYRQRIVTADPADAAGLAKVTPADPGLSDYGAVVRQAPSTSETRLDYDTRTDGNPVYVAKAPQGTATSAATWLVQKLTYDASARLTRAEVLTGSWDGRASLSW